MTGMARRRRALVSALLAGLVLVAVLPVPCGCQPRAVAAASEHGCCAPLASVRPAEPGCCAAVARAPEATTTAPERTVTLVPGLAVVAWAMPPALPIAERVAATPEPPTSPPRTVRRL